MRARWPRWFVAVSVLAGLAALGVGAVVGTMRPDLPPPELADRDQLVGWLVTRDLAAEPIETRRALVRRLEEEFRGGIPWDDTARNLTDVQRRRVWDNLPMLLEPWLLDKVDAYWAGTGPERLAVLDGVLASIKSWQGASVLRPEPTQPNDGEDRGFMAVLQDQVASLEDKADPSRRQRIEQFVAAVRARWFWRTLAGDS